MERHGMLMAVLALAGALGINGAPGAEAASNIAETVAKARQELKLAIGRAEQSLAEHQPGSGHTKQHMQQVLNVLEGRDGKHFNPKAESPGDGHGVMRYLAEAEAAMKGTAAPREVEQAIAHAKSFVEEAIEHAHRSVQGAGVEETHKHAALAAGLLQAAWGRENSGAPVTGALSLAAKQAAG